MVVRFFRRAVDVGVQAQVLVPVVWLGMFDAPGDNFIFVHVHGIVTGINPGGEFMQSFGVVIFAHAGVVAIIPIVDTTNQVAA